MLLIIEDEKLLADMVSDMCDNIMKNKVINSYISLLSMPVQELDTVNIILTDFYLGYNLTAEDVREYISLMEINCKIILMTGAILSDDIISKYDGILHKPFTLSELYNVFDKLKEDL